MINRIKRMPSILGWAACATLGAISAYLTTDVYIAVTALAAVAAYASATYYQARIRLEYRSVIRDIDAERAALSMGRRAPSIVLTIAELDGTMHSRTLAQILTDPAPEGGETMWHAPVVTVLHYADHVKADHEPA